MEGAVGSRRVAIKAEVLDDISSRFLINLSSEERADPIKLCSHIEVAHWYYLDLMRPEDHTLPACNLKEFMATVFQHCPWLVRGAADSSKDLEKLITDWKAHKYNKPVRGAILLNQDWTKCLLVQGYPSGTSWTFPKGKLEEGETDKDAAVREVFEETGFDIRVLIQKSFYLDAVIHDSNARMYIIPGVPDTTHFEAKTRKEIKNIKWFEIKDLPSYKKDQKALGGKTSNFFMVIPFIGQLRRWIEKKKGRRVSASFKIHSQAHNQFPPGSGRRSDNAGIPHVESASRVGQFLIGRTTTGSLTSASVPTLSATIGQVSKVPLLDGRPVGRAGPQQSNSAVFLQQQRVPLVNVQNQSLLSSIPHPHPQPMSVTPQAYASASTHLNSSTTTPGLHPTPLLDNRNSTPGLHPTPLLDNRNSTPGLHPTPLLNNRNSTPGLHPTPLLDNRNRSQLVSTMNQHPGLRGNPPNSGPPVNLLQQQASRPHAAAFQQQASPHTAAFQQQAIGAPYSHHSVLLPPNPVLQSGPNPAPFGSMPHQQFQPVPPTGSTGQQHHALLRGMQPTPQYPVDLLRMAQDSSQPGTMQPQSRPCRPLLPTPHSAQPRPPPLQKAHPSQRPYNHGLAAQVERQLPMGAMEQMTPRPVQHSLQQQQQPSFSKVPLLPLPSNATPEPHPCHPSHQPAIQMQRVPLLPAPPCSNLSSGPGQREDISFSLKPVPNFVNFRFDRKDILKNLRTY